MNYDKRSRKTSQRDTKGSVISGTRWQRIEEACGKWLRFLREPPHRAVMMWTVWATIDVPATSVNQQLATSE